MKLRGKRWQLCILVACVLVCVFAFTAKLSQYESLHTQVTNVTSNKIWSSAEKRSISASTFAERPSVTPITVLSFFLIVAPFTCKRQWIAASEHPRAASTLLSDSSSPVLFRRPPPSLF